MTLFALCLVLLAAVTHACWNLSAKYAADSRHFVWLFSAGSVLVYGPIVLAVWSVEQAIRLDPLLVSRGPRRLGDRADEIGAGARPRQGRGEAEATFFARRR